jgi:hypothetical protein
MQFPVKKPFVLAQSGVAVRSFTITALPAGPSAALANPNALLSIADTASLAAAGTPLWSAPLSALPVIGQPIVLGGGVTANGLAITQIPPGCAISVDFG